MTTTSSFKKDATSLLRRSAQQLITARNSISQLKLRELSSDDDTLERFSLQELRDGFFDPIYTKPVNVGCSILPPPPPPQSSTILHHDLSTKINSISNSVLENFTLLSKFTLAYFISMVLVLATSWFGKYPQWLPLATLIHHPCHPIGTQLEMTLQSLLGLGLALVWGIVTLQVSLHTNQGGIIAGSVIIGMFAIGWIRAYYIRLYHLFLTMGMILIFMLMSTPLDGMMHWNDLWDIGIPYIFGLAVSLVVSLVYFPEYGDEQMRASLLASVSSIKALLVSLSTVQSHDESITLLQKRMISATLSLSEEFREYLSILKVSWLQDEDLKSLRNHLNLVVGPLRVIPWPTYIYNDGHAILEKHDEIDTKCPNSDLTIMIDTFNAPLFGLISQMVSLLSLIESILKSLSTKSVENIEKLTKLKQELKTTVHSLDMTYRQFTKSDNFKQSLLQDESITNIFLVLRYSRQCAIMLISLTDIFVSLLTRTKRRIYLPTYPLKRALKQSGAQCLRDHGEDKVYRYFSMTKSVDEAFERIYNLNTSTHSDSPVEERSSTDTEKSVTDNGHPTPIRAIDHHDFNSHSTPNHLRFRLWEIATNLTGYESKYAVKLTFLITFLSLPGLLTQSMSWYHKYASYWCSVMVYYLLSPKNSSTWYNLSTRLVCWFCGCLFAWISAQAIHHRGILIGALSLVLCIPFVYAFLVKDHARSSYIGLFSFTIIALNLQSLHDQGVVWSMTWSLGIALVVSIFATVFTSWIVWPFSARRELYDACHSLLQHISQSYQSVSERYLYRDEDDDPTDLTLALANIREVRMSQSLQAVKLLLERAKREHDITKSFKPHVFEMLLNSCDLILEKTIEARMSGIHMKVWEQDQDPAITQILSSYRRDSVTTVIYVLYILSNAFLSRSQIPKYLPSAITIRKEMYDKIIEQEMQRQVHVSTTLAETFTDDNYEKIHWSEVHAMAFARAFTTITQELEKIASWTKEILGEDDVVL